LKENERKKERKKNKQTPACLFFYEKKNARHITHTHRLSKLVWKKNKSHCLSYEFMLK